MWVMRSSLSPWCDLISYTIIRIIYMRQPMHSRRLPYPDVSSKMSKVRGFVSNRLHTNDRFQISSFKSGSGVFHESRGEGPWSWRFELWTILRITIMGLWVSQRDTYSYTNTTESVQTTSLDNSLRMDRLFSQLRSVSFPTEGRIVFFLRRLRAKRSRRNRRLHRVFLRMVRLTTLCVSMNEKHEEGWRSICFRCVIIRISEEMWRRRSRRTLNKKVTENVVNSL